MTALRRLSDQSTEISYPPASGFRLRTAAVCLVPDALRQPVPSTPPRALADEPRPSGVCDNRQPAVAAERGGFERPSPNSGPTAEYDDAPGAYAWLGKLTCMLTAAATSACLLLTLLAIV